MRERARERERLSEKRHELMEERGIVSSRTLLMKKGANGKPIALGRSYEGRAAFFVRWNDRNARTVSR